MRGSLLSRIERLERHSNVDCLVVTILRFCGGRLIGYQVRDQFIARRGNETDEALHDRVISEQRPEAWGGIVIKEVRE